MTEQQPRYCINVCGNSRCIDRGASNAYEQLKIGLLDIPDVGVNKHPCFWECRRGPVVEFTDRLRVGEKQRLTLFYNVGLSPFKKGTSIKEVIRFIKQGVIQTQG